LGLSLQRTVAAFLTNHNRFYSKEEYCSGSQQGTKTQRIDMSFTPLSENEGCIARKTIH
jgi:hypothetical protein